MVGFPSKLSLSYLNCNLRSRSIIACQLERESREVFDGAIEVNESYFAGTRKGKRGRGAGGKISVFGLLKRGGRVYTKIILDIHHLYLP